MKVGITTTIPVEVLVAAGITPVDLNNIFITNEKAMKLVESAEVAGYPRNVCGWIKGIYGVVQSQRDIEKVIAVTQGDCSNTHALMETFKVDGIETIPFAYPYDRDKDLLKLQIEKLMAYFDVSWEQVISAKQRLDAVRKLVHKIDELTWKENLVTGWDNHLYQVSCSDFNSDIDTFTADVNSFLDSLEGKKPLQNDIRLAYIGVPPIMPDLYSYLEENGTRVVFNEVQRQFSMPYETNDIVEQYQLYTYPYDVFARIDDILVEVQKRKVDGIIHYTQSFCFRQIEDIIFRKKIDLPILTLEGEQPTALDARSKVRIDSFLEMLR